MTKSTHTPAYEKFRFLLVAAREKSKLTQAEVSSRLGRPQSFVAKYESGERRLDIIEFLQISEALEADPISIITELRKF